MVEVRTRRVAKMPESIHIDASDALKKKMEDYILDTSGIEPDTSRMLSERDKPTTPCALACTYDCK